MTFLLLVQSRGRHRRIPSQAGRALAHQAGHAITGRLAGYRVRLIRIGRGPELFRLHLGLSLLIWRLIPIDGSLAIYRPLADVRHARLMLIAGGGFANALVACGLVALLPLQPRSCVRSLELQPGAMTLLLVHSRGHIRGSVAG